VYGKIEEMMVHPKARFDLALHTMISMMEIKLPLQDNVEKL
jgi:hypothetical protein